MHGPSPVYRVTVPSDLGSLPHTPGKEQVPAMEECPHRLLAEPVPAVQAGGAR